MRPLSPVHETGSSDSDFHSALSWASCHTALSALSSPCNGCVFSEQSIEKHSGGRFRRRSELPSNSADVSVAEDGSALDEVTDAELQALLAEWLPHGARRHGPRNTPGASGAQQAVRRTVRGTEKHSSNRGSVFVRASKGVGSFTCACCRCIRGLSCFSCANRRSVGKTIVGERRQMFRHSVATQTEENVETGDMSSRVPGSLVPSATGTFCSISLDVDLCLVNRVRRSESTDTSFESFGCFPPELEIPVLVKNRRSVVLTLRPQR
eukprot:GHVU01153714.1.p1 GENE.GHVU01153714.1~~GHVU01153714.1.p1  ORF type:complete len:266 (+),score=-1.93 GHVU01153714.1:128-925(+)